MSSFLDKAKALGGKAVEATADAVEIGTLKAKIAARKGDIEKQYEALGEIIYENRSTLELNPEEDPENDSGTDAEKDPEDDEKDDGKEEKAGFFGRRKDKEKEKLKTQVEELNDRLLRSLAEFDNYRKRTEKEKTANYAIGARDVVEKILPVADSFERGLSSAPEEDPFAEGMRMIYKQLMTALEDLGVRPIEAVGQPFDPNLHNAVMHVDDEEAGENVVVEEFQKGYTYKDSVVRHSMVKVAN